MNSYTKPKCSTRSTPTKKIRRAPCNIGFITRDGKIRKSHYDFLPIVWIENFLFSFTALLYSTALKHQPPHFDTRASQHLLFYLLFFLLHTSFSSTASTVLIDPNLSSLLAGRGISSLQLSSNIRHFHSTISSYITLSPLSLFAAIVCRIAFPLVHRTNTHALRQLG